MTKDDYFWLIIRFFGVAFLCLAIYQLLFVGELVLDFINLEFNEYDEYYNELKVKNWLADFWPVFSRLVFFGVFSFYFLAKGVAVFNVISNKKKSDD